MSGSSGGANLPINIRLTGAAEAEAAFNRVGTTAGTAMQRVGQSTEQATGSARNFGHVVGQAGFQVQDFAVQVQGGTSALTALSQQGSQLLGVFGTGGAIAGAALTVGILGAQLLGLSSNADKLKDALDALDAAYASTDASARQYRDSLDEEARRIRDLTAYYGSLSESVAVYERRRLTASANTIRTERDDRVRDVVSPLTGVIGAARGDVSINPMGDAFGFVVEGTQALTTQLEQLRQTVAAFQNEVIPTKETIAALENRLVSLGQVSGPTGEAIKAVLAAIRENEGALLRTGEGMEQLRQRMVAAGMPIEDVNKLLGQSTLNADQLTAALARLRNAANNPISNLGTSLSNVNEELRALRTGGLAAAEETVRRQRAEAAAQSAQDRAEAFVRGNSGLGGDQLAEAIREARTEAEGLSRAVTDGEASRDRLREQLTAAGRAAREASQEFQDLRLHTSGLLVGNTSDARVAGEIAANPAVRAQQALRTAAERQQAEATRTAEREETRRQNEADRFTQNWGDRIALETTRGLIEGTKNGETAAQRFGNALKNILMSSVSAVLSRNLFQPLVQAGYSAFSGAVGGTGIGSFLGFGGSTLGGAAGVSTAGSLSGGMNQAGQSLGLYQAGSYGNLGNAFTTQGAMANTGYGWVDGALNATLYNSGTAGSAMTNSGFNAGTAMAGEAGNFAGGGGQALGLSVGNAIGGVAGVAGGAYGIYSGIQKGGVGGAAQVAGGALSAVGGGMLLAGLGSIGPVGWAIAAILAIAGAILPGEKPSGKGQLARLNLDSDTQSFEGLGGDRFSQGNRDAATDTVSRIADMARQLGDKLGGARIGGNVAVGVTSSRGKGVGDLYLEIGSQKGRYTNDEAGSKALAADAAQMVLNEFKGSGRVTGDVGNILGRSGTVEELSQNLDWYEKVYKTFSETTPKVSAFDQSLKQVETSMNALIDKAHALGLSSDDLVAARTREIEKVKEQRTGMLIGFRENLQVRNFRLGGNNEAADLIQFDAGTRNEVKAARDALEAAGYTAAEVLTEIASLEQTLTNERLDIQKRYAAQAAAEQRAQIDAGASSALGVITSLRDYTTSLTTGEASAGTAMDRYGAASRQFDAIFGAAAAGDANSIAGLQGAAETYRTNAREIFGGGQGYVDALRLIGERLDGIGGMGAQQLTQSFITENARTNTDRVVDALAKLEVENARLRADINMLMMRPAA